jgi:predicted short-subunit dehydrogenase-like oxidoreductase (DUF2520 family)
MRELERDHAADTHPTAPARAGQPADARTRPFEGTVAVAGPGRLGRALAEALDGAGVDVSGPYGRGPLPEADAIVLCVPDSSIREAAEAAAGRAPLVGHTSGATPLTALDPVLAAGGGAFGLHPLQTFPGEEADASRFRGCGCAVAGSDGLSLRAAESLARSLGMDPFVIEDDDRAAYHAAASIASNFLLALEDAAESVAAGAGLEPARARAVLAPLVRSTVENWARLGPGAALTGPVRRGDELTVAAQRAAVERVSPELTGLFDLLLAQTRRLASKPARSST